MAEPTLEGLPAELQIDIIENISDFDTLRNLVHASPACYRAYVRVRQKVLLRLVQLQYEEDRVDVAEDWVAVRSAGLCAERQGNKAEILTLLDYRRRPNEIRKIRGDRTPWSQLTVEECIKLLHLSRKLNFLTHDCYLTLQRPLFLEDEEALFTDRPLSGDEKTRFLRAFYRLQTYSNIFGVDAHDSVNPARPWRDWYGDTFPGDEVWSLFFATMPPWEVEEIGCVATYLLQKYEKIFAEIADDLSHEGPRYRDVEPWESDAASRNVYPNSPWYPNYLDHMVNLGPCFLYRVSKQKSYEEYRDLVQSNLWINGFSFLDLAGNTRGVWHLLSPADIYEENEGRLEAYLSALPPLGQPNFGWRMYWFPLEHVGMTVLTEDMCGVMPPYHGFGNRSGWEWSYVIWDSERLLEWGVSRLPTVVTDGALFDG